MFQDQTPNGVPYNEGSEPYSDEEDFDLRDVSSDAEMDSAALDGISDDEEYVCIYRSPTLA